MKPIIKALPLKKQIVILITVLGLCILIISLYSTLSYSSQLAGTVEKNQELYFNQLLLSAEDDFEEIGHICSSIAYNQIVQQFLLEREPDRKFSLYQNVINLLNNTKTLNSRIVDISVLGETNNSANLSGDISVYSELYNEFPSNFDTVHFFGKTDFFIAGNRYTCLVAAMPVYQLSDTYRKFIGIAFITIDPASFFSVYYSQQEKIGANEFIFTDSNNQLILGNHEFYKLIQDKKTDSQNFTIRKDNRVYQVKQARLQLVNGTLYSYFDQSFYDREMFYSIFQQTVSIISIFIAATFFLLAAYKSISQSLVQLNKIMNKISSGKWSGLNERITLDPDKSYSIEVISTATAFNNMLDEINRLNHNIFTNYTKMYELEVINKKTEIAFLRSQINPHFLYNTLSLICGMASVNKSEEIIEVTRALSQIFRYSITGNDVVTLEQELEVTKNYVMIQARRFEDRFRVEYIFTEETYSALIPRMILQPLVENAIIHGLERSMHKGLLQIGGRINKKDNTLVLWVYDTGVGIPKEDLDTLRELLNENAVTESPYPPKFTVPFAGAAEDESHPLYQTSFGSSYEDSIGLCNVNRRISLCFGKPYQLHIDSEENVGTNVQIKIPHLISPEG